MKLTINDRRAWFSELGNGKCYNGDRYKNITNCGAYLGVSVNSKSVYVTCAHAVTSPDSIYCSVRHVAATSRFSCDQ